MSTSKRREDTDIDHFLYPKLAELGIPRENIRRNISTTHTGRFRGDLWISLVADNNPNFEDRIIGLIECKDHTTMLNDPDWLDAKDQGKRKAERQGLKSFFITNTRNITRCYNTITEEEIKIDNVIINEVQVIPVLRAIQTQVNETNSNVIYSTFSSTPIPNANQFRSSLWNLRQIYRSCGISKGKEDSIIKSTLTFCILKLITEKQSIERTVPNTIFLWDDWRSGQMRREIDNTINDLIVLPNYNHLQGCLGLDEQITNDACIRIHRELSQYSFFGGDFDFFGLIYETLAPTQQKKDFGEFYTPRHIIRVIVNLLLKNELTYRPIKIADPACGTGGFLVEALLYLQRKFRENGSLTEEVLRELRYNTFFGYDNSADVAIPFARTNMMMAGNSGTTILSTEDSLITFEENEYDYIMANVPYGQYTGSAEISSFSYTNNRRFELLFLEKIVQGLKYGGKAAVIIPDGLVENVQYASYRHAFLLDVNLFAIISLPPFAFEPYTPEKTYVLFFQKKIRSQIGRMQEIPVWHYIIDHDGFQEGKKRYPINENDIPELEYVYLSEESDGKYGFTEINEINEDNFYRFCSEFHIRKPEILDISYGQYETLTNTIYKHIFPGDI